MLEFYGMQNIKVASRALFFIFFYFFFFLSAIHSSHSSHSLIGCSLISLSLSLLLLRLLLSQVCFSTLCPSQCSRIRPMDVYSLTKKQRPTHLTRGQVNKSAHNSAMTSGQITTAAAAVHSTTTATSAAAMAQIEQKYSQLPPQYRQALLEQQQRQQQQQQQYPSAPPTLQEIESKHSQLPPQYRQAVLEQQQREHQLRYQNGASASPPRQPSHSASLHSSPTHGNGTNASRRGPVGMNSHHQRIVSAPLMSSHRANSRQGVESSSSSPGPSRAHWKPDSSTHICTWPGCRREFGLFDRRHHCRKCGDIFCSAHCSKSVPLDQVLDFNPGSGVQSRACNGCFEAYEQWQGLIPSPNSGRAFGQYSGGILQEQKSKNGAFGTIPESQLPNGGEFNKAVLSPPLGLNRRTVNTGHIPEGLLGQHNLSGSNSSGETLGREDIVRAPKSASENIAIKTRPVQDPTTMPMPSVPHDWSWSTF